MAPHAAEFAASVRRELLLLRDLAADLIACRKALTGSDLERIYEHVARQSALSEQLSAAQQDRRRAWNALATASVSARKNTGASIEPDLHSTINALDPESAAEIRSLLTELALAEGEVRNLNRIHTLLLDGSRRTLNVLSNALAAFAPLYAPPTRRPSPSDAPAIHTEEKLGVRA